MIKVVGVILIDTYDKSQIDDLDGKIWQLIAQDWITNKFILWNFSNFISVSLTQTKKKGLEFKQKIIEDVSIHI